MCLCKLFQLHADSTHTDTVYSQRQKHTRIQTENNYLAHNNKSRISLAGRRPYVMLQQGRTCQISPEAKKLLPDKMAKSKKDIHGIDSTKTDLKYKKILLLLLPEGL